jgi:integrase
LRRHVCSQQKPVPRDPAIIAVPAENICHAVPDAVSSDWGEAAEGIGMPEITFHALRHTHASQLIASRVDIVTISKRLGPAKPSVTLAIYAHMFTSDDCKAAAAINAALSG